MRALVFLFVIAAANPAHADERTEARLGPDSKTTPNLAAATAATQAKGSWRFPGSWVGAYEADSGMTGAPGMTRFNDALRQRFSLGAEYKKGNLDASLRLSIYDFDGISQRHANQSETVPIALRHAFVAYRSPVGLWRLGATESRWGLGLVAGGRSAYSTLTHTFDFRTPSDSTAGLSYGAKIGKLTAGLSGAYVLRDENADLLNGDLGQQGVAVLRYRANTTDWLGMYGAYRRQKDADGSFLTAMLIDLAGAIEGPVFASDRWRLAFEAAHLFGETDRVLSESAFAQGQTSMQLRSFGAAAILGLETMNRRLSIELEGGYAGADRNPEDDYLSRFTFDQNYGVGMILIPGLLRHSHEASVLQASDPGRVGQPQRGIERLKSEGRVAGVTYLNPRLSFRMRQGSRQTGLHLGLVVAGLPDGSADPYMSFRKGEPTNAFGAASEHLLGYELNAGLTWSAKLQRRYALRLSLEGAAAQAGPALSSADSNNKPILALRTGFALRAMEKEAK
jgi:hypothetical protein